MAATGKTDRDVAASDLAAPVRDAGASRLDTVRDMRILVVDTPDRAAGTAAVLAGSGFPAVRTASDEESALAALREGDRAPATDLVLLNTEAPELGGYRLCATIREREAWRDIPVIAVQSSAPWRDDMLTGAFDAGVTGLMFHTSNPVELVPRVVAALLLKRERDIRRNREAELEAELAERRVMEARLQYLVSHDELTGLSNRRRLEQVLDDAITRMRHEGTTGALVYIDLDQFKIINDLEGHAAGDRLLMGIANILRSRLQPRHLLARISSDEYAVLLEQTTEGEVIALAESIRRGIEHYRFHTDDREYQVSASVGVAILTPDEPVTPSEALARSAQACFEAKTHGRNVVHVFDKTEAGTSVLHEAVDWVPRIRDALAHDRFTLVFQPVIEVDGGRAVAYEALIRMIQPDGTVVLPEHFIPVAEHMGLIHDIDLWVVGRAIDTLKALDGDQAGLTLNVNLSIHAFQDPALLALVRERLARTGVAPERITFEITETAAVANYEQTRSMVNALREAGCRFALDDFGTGFSSFNYLRQFPVDYLKIDGSFIRNLLNDPIDQRLVRSIVEVGRALGKRIVAEFVEDARTLDLLRQYGVDRAQGNYIGEPVSRIPGA